VKFCYDIVCCDTCTLSVKVIYSDQTWYNKEEIVHIYAV
jgi:hypothetical protein